MNRSVFTNNFAKKYHHKDFILKINMDGVIENDIKPILNFLERSIISGKGFNVDEIVQFGMMLCKVVDHGDGYLTLHEPDMCSMPIEWSDTLTNTIKFLRAQKDTIKSYGLLDQMSISDIGYSALIGTDYQHAKEFILDRIDIHDNDSGWFFGNLHTKLDYNDPGNLIRVSLYEAVLGHLNLVRYLAMPENTKIVVAIKDVTVYFHEKEIEPQKGSFMEAYLKILKDK